MKSPGYQAATAGGPRRSRNALAGFTLTEAVIAVVLTGVSLSTVFTLSLQALNYVDATREATAATLAVQERIEQLRSTPSWRDLLDDALSLLGVVYAVSAAGHPVENERPVGLRRVDPACALEICLDLRERWHNRCYQAWGNVTEMEFGLERVCT